MLELIAGLLAVLFWGVLQFVVQATTGYIHLLLAAGVLLVVRGIVAMDRARPAE